MKYLRIMIICLALGNYLYALSLSEKYPNYSYIFHEFNIDESYIDNADFIYFAMQNEEKMKSFYSHSLQRGKMILPTLQGLLLNDGVSDLFIYLSMVESGFLSTAVSSKKAVGLWQFMPATARRYNLKVCKSYDERCDIVSSTSAAIAYLNKLYKQFGKWCLAAMAYNCGEGCIQKAIHKAGSDDLAILTDERNKYLPKETRQYIKKILLLAMIGERKTLDFAQVNHMSSKSDFIEVEIAKETPLKEIADILKMDKKELLMLNKKFENRIKSNYSKTIKITIPIEKVYAFYLRYELPEKTVKSKFHFISHYVALGETLESIAKMYKITVDEIKIVNHLPEEYLSVDQFLVIPVSERVFEEIESKKLR